MRCLTPKRTRPYTPRTNGKAERSIKTLLAEWAYSMPFQTSGERNQWLPRYLAIGERRALEAWAGPRPLMLRSNRCGSGLVHHHPEDERLGMLPSGSLNPQKARVLLLLASIAGFDRAGLGALMTQRQLVN